MLGRPAPKAGEGLLLTPCQSVHMYGMRFPLDVAFLESQTVWSWPRIGRSHPALGAGGTGMPLMPWSCRPAPSNGPAPRWVTY